jgi:hypothetical protein
MGGVGESRHVQQHERQLEGTPVKHLPPSPSRLDRHRSVGKAECQTRLLIRSEKFNRLLDAIRGERALTDLALRCGTL